MKLSTFIFHVDSKKTEVFRNIVADYFKLNYPDAQKKGTLTLANNHLIVETYDFDWLWSEVSSFVDTVCGIAKYKKVLVVCESVNF